MGHANNSLTQLRVIRSTSTGLADALDYFITAKEAERCTARTIETYRWGLTRFIGWLEEQGVTEAGAVTAYHIRKFFTEQEKAGYSASSVHIFARVIKTWLRFLHSEDLIPNDPMAKVTMPRLDKEILPAFTPDNVKKLLSACASHRDTALVYFLLDTGVRASELCALTIDDVTLTTGGVRVIRGKGRKDRLVFLGAKSRLALRKYLMQRKGAEPAEPLFPSLHTGKALDRNGLLLWLRRLGKRASVDHCNPHTFRRTFALWSLRAGMNIYALQEIMGHSDLTVLRRYLALVEEDLQEAHRKHGAVDNML